MGIADEFNSKADGECGEDDASLLKDAVIAEIIMPTAKKMTEKDYKGNVEENHYHLPYQNSGFIISKTKEIFYAGVFTDVAHTKLAIKDDGVSKRISAMGVWNVIQALGEKVCGEEKALVESHKKDRLHGEKEVPILFKEADGVYIGLRGKVWYILPEKIVVAGFAKAKEFHEYREAAIAERYNLDEVSQRILNADGASRIRKVKDKSTCFQMDPFHRNKAVKEKIHNQKAVHDIMELLEEEKTEELFCYLKMYRDSLWEVGEIEDAEDLIQYYENNDGKGYEYPVMGHLVGLEGRIRGDGKEICQRLLESNNVFSFVFYELTFYIPNGIINIRRCETSSRSMFLVW